jgi:hypothetical protein
MRLIRWNTNTRIQDDKRQVQRGFQPFTRVERDHQDTNDRVGNREKWSASRYTWGKGSLDDDKENVQRASHYNSEKSRLIAVKSYAMYKPWQKAEPLTEGRFRKFYFC